MVGFFLVNDRLKVVDYGGRSTDSMILVLFGRRIDCQASVLDKAVGVAE